jgi:predicted lipoprotein with Yx(FWY)xxD motif
MRKPSPRAVIVLALAALGLGAVVAAAKLSVTTLKAEKASALHLTVLADAKGRTLYHLKPETPHHLLCKSSACLSVWHPTTVATKTAHVKLPKGITGKVTLLHRGHAYQVVLSGKPLYRFDFDTKVGDATGQHIHSFHGVWGVLKTKTAAKKSTKPAPAPPTIPGY